MSRLPVDHDIRSRAAEQVETSIALAAGAGAGKTSVLVRRLALCLAGGTDPSRIAAITFTEKAAGEILHRVRLELEASEADVDPEAVSRVTVSTLHAFARSLLAEEPLEARWAPGTEVLERASVAEAVDAWWSDLRQRRPGLAVSIDELCSPNQRRGLVDQLLANRDLAPRVAEPVDDDALFAALREVRERIEAEAAGCRAPDCKLLRGNDGFRAELSGWMTLPPAEAVRVAAASDLKPSKRGGRASDWPPGGKERFKEALDGLAAWRGSVGASVHGELVREVREHVVPVVLAARHEQAVATFDDLLFRTAELLRDQDAVRARLAGRFDRVLIDEVQDTDPLQAEVALLLAREVTATGAWSDAPPRPGALFAVGDRQQSIYRFRRADVETWAQLSALVARGGEQLSLSQNFRSVPGILAWVAQVFGDGAHPQVPWRDPAALDPVVVVHTDDDHELEHAVAWASEVLRGGQVVDRESGVLRPVTAGDFLFLVPRWKNADALASRLERAGIRAEVEGGRTFFLRDEVRLGVAALACLVEPGDTEAAALVLKGLFGCSLADLVRHRAEGGSLRLTLEQPPGRVGDALRALGAVRREGGGSLAGLLDAVMEASGAAPAWVLRADADARFANLDKLRKLVLDEERAGGTRLEVLERIREQARASNDEDLSLTEPDREAARITTIFKAKGLEAPVVVLLDMDKRVDAGDSIVLRDRGEVLLKVGKGLKPPGWDAAAEDEKEQVRQEIGRLAYVAATRARDQLVVLSGASRRSIIKVFEPGLPPASAERERVAVGEATVLSVPGGSLDEAPDEGAVFPGHDARIDAALADGAATDGVEAEREQALALRVRAAKRASTRWEAATERAARRRGRGRPEQGGGFGPEADRLGTALHGVLEHLDLRAERSAQEAAVDRLAPAMVRLQQVNDPEGAAKVASAAKRILDHPMMERVRGAKRLLKEVPFVTGDGRTRVTGTIDLAFPLDDAETRWQVVDWKLHVPESGAARDRYDEQLRMYARAVLAGVSPCEQVETALVGPFAELPPPQDTADSLELVLDAMRPLLRAILAAGAPEPAIGVVLADSDVEGELVWEDKRVAVLDGPAEAVEGWTVFGSGVDADEVVRRVGE